MMISYYDRAGEPMTEDQWIERFGDREYKVVRQDTIGGFLVSTVWLGLDHNMFGAAPHIFETMVFDQREDAPDAERLADWDEMEQRRYSTEAAARAGHTDVLNRLADMLADLGSSHGHDG